MTYKEGKLGILFVLFVQSAIWSFSTCLPAKSDQLSPWGGNSDWIRRRTTRRPYWDRFTSSPGGYEYNSTSAAVDPIFWLILFGGIFVFLFMLLIKYLCKCDDSSTEESSATLHPPPVRIVPPPNRSIQSYGSQNTRNSNTSSTVTSYNFSTVNSSGVSSTYSAGDRPPGYFTVVSDSGEGKMKFPEVAPKPPESPPPKYEDGSLPRY